MPNKKVATLTARAKHQARETGMDVKKLWKEYPLTFPLAATLAVISPPAAVGYSLTSIGIARFARKSL